MDYIDKINHNYDNPITRPIIDAIEIEDMIFNEELQDLNNQFYLKYATWGVDDWEEMLGIPKNVFDLETRKENIKAKMRSRGTSTTDVIKNICESYSNGKVDIFEYPEEYRFVIKFVGTLGIPKAIDQLDKVIDEIKPCHLAHKFEYTFITWNEFDKYNYPWDKWDTLNLTWDEFEIYRKEGVL